MAKEIKNYLKHNKVITFKDKILLQVNKKNLNFKSKSNTEITSLFFFLNNINYQTNIPPQELKDWNHILNYQKKKLNTKEINKKIISKVKL